jgi:hypothetical protein
MVSLSGLTVNRFVNGNPWYVTLSAHTVLELYAYTLATTRSPRGLLASVFYLTLAAIIESLVIINYKSS